MTFEKTREPFQGQYGEWSVHHIVRGRQSLKTDDLSVATHYLKPWKMPYSRIKPWKPGWHSRTMPRYRRHGIRRILQMISNPLKKAALLSSWAERNQKPDLIADKISRCKSSGFSNIVAVTGDCTPATGKTRPKNFDSVHILNQIGESEDKSINRGCVVNPTCMRLPQFIRNITSSWKK